MKRKLLSGITVLFMIIAVIFTACPGDDSGGSSGGGPNGPNPTTPPHPWEPDLTLPPINTNTGEEVPGTNDPDDPENPNPPSKPNGTLQDDDLTLSVTVPGDDLPIGWRWFVSDEPDYDKGTPIPNADGGDRAEYNPPTNEVGTKYYWVVISLASGRGTRSQIREVVVLPKIGTNAVVPTFTIQPVGKIYAKDAVAEPLTFTAETPDNGDLTYQWYSNDKASNEGGTEINGMSSTAPSKITISGSYTPVNLNTPTILYYYVVVTNTIANAGDGGIYVRTAKSNVAAIIVKNEVRAKTPVIITHPVSDLYSTNQTPKELTVVVDPDAEIGGTLSYQWYKNQNNTTNDGILIPGATTASYSPDTSVHQSIWYYYCEVTNTLDDEQPGDVILAQKTAKAYSQTAYIAVSVTPINLGGLRAEGKVYDGNMEAIITGTPRDEVIVNGQKVLKDLPIAGTKIKLAGFTPDNPANQGTNSAPTIGKAKGLFASPDVAKNIKVEIQGVYLTCEDDPEILRNFFLVIPVLNAEITQAEGCPVTTVDINGADVRGKNVTIAQGSRLVALPELGENPTDAQVKAKDMNMRQLAQQTAIEYQAGTKISSAGYLVGSPVTSLKISGLSNIGYKANGYVNGYWFFARSKATQNFKAGPWSTNPDSILATVTKPGATVTKPTKLESTDTSITVNAVTVNKLVSNAGNDWQNYDTRQTPQYAISTLATLANNFNINPDSQSLDYRRLVWQSSTTFKNISTYNNNGNTVLSTMVTTPLSTVTTYYVYARAAEDADFEAGPPVVSDAIATGKPKVYFVTDSINNLPPVETEKYQPFASTKILPITKPDYDLEGWYINSSKTIPYNFAAPVLNSITIYARWTLKSEKNAMRARQYVPMVQVPSGWFLMGSTDANRNVSEEDPHWVGVSGFWMGMYEITQEEWTRVMGANNNPSGNTTANLTAGENQNRRPVDNIRWYDALVFCNYLSLQEKLTPVYHINVPIANGGSGSDSVQPANWGPVPASNNDFWNEVTIDPRANGFRLPTEAQWEYACRAGTTTYYNTGGTNGAGSNTWQNTYGWSINDSASRTHEVGKKTPNNWGLFDMHGNVWEHTFDFNWSYALQYKGAEYYYSANLLSGYAPQYRLTAAELNNYNGTMYQKFIASPEIFVDLQGLPYKGRDGNNNPLNYRNHVLRGGAYDCNPGQTMMNLRSAARTWNNNQNQNGCTTYQGFDRAISVGLRVVRPY